MSAYVDIYSLNIKNVPDSYDYKRKELKKERKGMKIFTVVFVVFILYDLLISSMGYGNDRDENLKKFKYALIANLVSLSFIIVCYIILPFFNIFFNGISLIPMGILVVVELELNIYLYDYVDIGTLYNFI